MKASPKPFSPQRKRPPRRGGLGVACATGVDRRSGAPRLDAHGVGHLRNVAHPPATTSLPSSKRSAWGALTRRSVLRSLRWRCGPPGCLDDVLCHVGDRPAVGRDSRYPGRCGLQVGGHRRAALQMTLQRSTDLPARQPGQDGRIGRSQYHRDGSRCPPNERMIISYSRTLTVFT